MNKSTNYIDARSPSNSRSACLHLERVDFPSHCLSLCCCYLLEAFLLWASHSCFRFRKPSIWAEGVSWVLAGKVAALWAGRAVLALRSEVGEGMGLDSFELVLCSAAPLTISPVSTVSAI